VRLHHAVKEVDMTRVLHCGSLIGVLMLGLACGTERPTAPSAVPAPPPPQPPQPLPSGEPVATYIFYSLLDYPVRGFTTGSQYLLYNNGVFGLRYDAFPHVYLGTYRQDNATITFRFDDAWTWDRGWSCLSDSRPTGGLCPFATGTLKGDLLEVRYGDSMQHSDFENAIYRRFQQCPPPHNSLGCHDSVRDHTEHFAIRRCEASGEPFAVDLEYLPAQAPQRFRRTKQMSGGQPTGTEQKVAV